MLLQGTRTLVNKSKKVAMSAIGGGHIGTGHTKSSNTPKKVLVTGAGGQLGTELTQHLKGIFGDTNVIASDVKLTPSTARSGHFAYIDVTDYDTLAKVVLEYNVDIIVHLAALLSAVGEKNTKLAISVNNKGLENCLSWQQGIVCRSIPQAVLQRLAPALQKISLLIFVL